jgi:hypothetical protein
MTRTPRSSSASDLLVALRAAGCDVFLDDDQLFCSQPVRPVDWVGDVEDAIDEAYWELKVLVSHERLTVH